MHSETRQLVDVDVQGLALKYHMASFVDGVQAIDVDALSLVRKSFHPNKHTYQQVGKFPERCHSPNHPDVRADIEACPLLHGRICAPHERDLNRAATVCCV